MNPAQLIAAGVFWCIGIVIAGWVVEWSNAVVVTSILNVLGFAAYAAFRNRVGEYRSRDA